MNQNEDMTKVVGEIKNEEDALDQSVALNKIVMQLLKTRAQECKRLWVALVISILVNLAIVGGFLWYESQWEYTTTTTEVEQDSGEDGLNMLQVGDNSRMVLGYGEDAVNGQAISEGYNEDQVTQGSNGVEVQSR